MKVGAGLTVESALKTLTFAKERASVLYSWKAMTPSSLMEYKRDLTDVGHIWTWEISTLVNLFMESGTVSKNLFLFPLIELQTWRRVDRPCTETSGMRLPCTLFSAPVVKWITLVHPSTVANGLISKDTYHARDKDGMVSMALFLDNSSPKNNRKI